MKNSDQLQEKINKPSMQGYCKSIFAHGLDVTDAGHREAYIAIMAMYAHKAMLAELGEAYTAGWLMGALDDIKGVTISQSDSDRPDTAQPDPERQRLTQENYRLRQLLNTAGGLLFRLEQYHFIQTEDDEFEPQVDHFRDIGRTVVDDARKILDTQFNAKTEM